MTLALNIALIAGLILTAALGGYVLAQVKHSAILEARSLAYRAQITRLRRLAASSDEERNRVAGDLDRAKRRLRRYEQALYAQQMAEPQPAPYRTAHYDMPEISAPAPSGHLDGEVLQDVKKTVDVDRFRVNFVRREIA